MSSLPGNGLYKDATVWLVCVDSQREGERNPTCSFLAFLGDKKDFGFEFTLSMAVLSTG